MPAVKKETIISEHGYVDELLEFVAQKSILEEEEYDENKILDFLDKIVKKNGDTFIIAKVAKRMEQLDYPPSYIAGVVDILARASQTRITAERQLIEGVSKSIAQEISKVDLRIGQRIWVSPEIIDLSVARKVPELIADYNDEPDCVIYLPDSTGTGTIFLDSQTAHPFAMGTQYWEVRRHPFRQLYLSNEAQPGCYMYILVGRGDITMQEAVRVQGQYRPTIALTTTPLAANAVYTSTWFSAVYLGHLSYLTNADVASAVNGVRLQESNDGVTPHFEQRQSTTAITIGGVNSFYARLDSIPRSRYVRIIYVNGAAVQNLFSLLCLGRAI